MKSNEYRFTDKNTPQKTMNDLYKDGSECKACEKCGLCKDCGDCTCDKRGSRIFIVNGFPRSGKDTFSNFLIEAFQAHKIYGALISSVENVKPAAKLLGWNEVKDEHGRNALSSLKDFSTEWFDGPFNMMSENVGNMSESEALIFMVREPEEIERFVKKYPQTITIFVSRNESERAENHADQNVENYDYDIYVRNNGSLDSLRETAEYIAAKYVGGGE